MNRETLRPCTRNSASGKCVGCARYACLPCGDLATCAACVLAFCRDCRSSSSSLTPNFLNRHQLLATNRSPSTAVRPQRALCGGIPSPFLEPSPRSWSHFMGIYRQKMTRSLEN